MSQDISIRAPARGATQGTDQPGSDYHISIRAPARGATRPRSRFEPGTEFQSALPRGERLHECAAVAESNHFNPRSREGSDREFTADNFAINISIRAPARGATQRLYAKTLCHIFQSALPRGERQQFSPKSSLLS